MAYDVYLGIDVGSVTAKIVVIHAEEGTILHSLYLRTHGDPIAALRQGLAEVKRSGDYTILGSATTGSGRTLAAKLIGTELVKNEITTHTLAALAITPDVQTILEIGGQDSKIIIVRNGFAIDFAMNNVCAAGTGSFLDQQAGRLGIKVDDFGSMALQSDDPATISGRCTVFAETDMIHKQQIGVARNDIIAGLCKSLVRNYLATVGRGKQILGPVFFQGGVAANTGIIKEFEKQLGLSVQVSKYFDVAGAYGAAIYAKKSGPATQPFTGFDILERDYKVKTFTCRKCEEECTVLQLMREEKLVSFWNDRCGRYSNPEPLL